MEEEWEEEPLPEWDAPIPSFGVCDELALASIPFFSEPLALSEFSCDECELVIILNLKVMPTIHDFLQKGF